MVLVNKDLDHTAEVRVDHGREPALKSPGLLFRLPNPPGPPTREALAIGGGRTTISLPPLTAALLVVP